jgi:UDP-N-acetylglucosamine acyltransferase
LDSSVEVGPFAVIGADVEIGAGTRIGPHAVVNGITRLGRDNRIFQFASIGEDPQDKKYGGEPTRLEIGDRNQIREYVTIHRGTVQDQGMTRIGNDNLLMAYVHVAHDCRIGNQVIMANAASLGGHVEVQDWAILGGFTIVHQFSRIGAHSFCAMGSVLTKDVPPYVTVSGHPAEPHGINVEGLKRRGFAEGSIQAIKRAYRLLYLSQLKLAEAILELRRIAEEAPEVGILIDFILDSRRSIVR